MEIVRSISRSGQFMISHGLVVAVLVGVLTRPSALADEFRPRRVLSAQPAITNAPMIAGAAVRDEVSANELVLGVVISGQARAYPINMLTGPRREIINDVVGGKAIAATW
jgi:hypothetical protein